jgi:hypothetical protein
VTDAGDMALGALIVFAAAFGAVTAASGWES